MNTEQEEDYAVMKRRLLVEAVAAGYLVLEMTRGCLDREVARHFQSRLARLLEYLEGTRAKPVCHHR